MPEYKDVTYIKKQIADCKRAIQSSHSDYLTGYVCALSATEGVIAEAPTADVVEVRHGEWEKIRYLEACVNRYQHTCNVCGKSYFDNNANFNYPYCPNCGAKMDGKEVANSG